MSKFILLKDLEVYKLARELSKIAWEVYSKLDWRDKKTFGDQFLDSTDSTGANIAEGYHRFHFLDKIKFYYNARGSLAEAAEHWLELLQERGRISQKDYVAYKKIAKTLSVKLNNFIKTTYVSKNNKSQ